MKRKSAFFAVTLSVAGLVALLTFSFVRWLNGETMALSRLMSSRYHVLPDLTPSQVFHDLVVGLIAWLPTNGMELSFAICAAIVFVLNLTLVFFIAFLFVREVYEPECETERGRMMLSVAAGAAASLSLGFSLPFWQSSMTLSAGAIDALLFSLCLLLLLKFWISGRYGVLLTAVFVYGAASVEAASLIVLLPVATVFVLFCMWKHGQLNWAAVLGVIIAGFAGSSMYFVAAARFLGSSGAAARGATSLQAVFYLLLRDHLTVTLRECSRSGWIVYHMLTTVPFIGVLVASRKIGSQDREWSDYMLYLILTLALVVSLGRLPEKLWASVFKGVKHHAPFVMAALAAAGLVPLWATLCRERLRLFGSDRYERTMQVLSGIGFAMVLMLPLALPVRNFESVDARSSGAIVERAHNIVRSLKMTGDKKVLFLGDGSVDVLVGYEARLEGVDLQVLSLSYDRDPYYRASLSTRFDNPKLKSLARAGTVPLVRGVLERGENMYSVVLQSSPDLIRDTDLKTLPWMQCFLTTDGDKEIDAEALYDKHIPLLKYALEDKNYASMGQYGILAEHLDSNVSRVLNDLGVLLEREGSQKQAVEAYLASWHLRTNSFACVINLAAASRKDPSIQLPSGVEQRFSYIEKLKGNRDLKQLVGKDGLIYSTKLLEDLALTDKLALRALPDAPGTLDILDFDEALIMDRALTDDLITGFSIECSDPVHDADLTPSIKKLNALRQAVADGRFDLVESLSLELKNPEREIADFSSLFSAMSLFKQDRVQEGEAEVERLVAARPDFQWGWILMIDYLAASRDEETLRSVIKHLKDRGGNLMPLEYAIGRHAWMNGDKRVASGHFVNSFIMWPESSFLKDVAVYSALRSGDLRVALDAASAVLAIDTRHALANYAMGVWQAVNDRGEMAITSFRASLESQRTCFALNDLAWLLCKKGELNEAEALINECMAVDDTEGDPWDTLGMIQLARGDLKSAEESVSKAYDLSENEPKIGLHYAEVLLAGDDRAGAAVVLKDVIRESDALLKTEQKKLKQLQKKLKPLLEK